MAEQDGPPIAANVEKRHEVLGGGRVDLLQRRRDKVKYGGEHLRREFPDRKSDIS